MALLNTLSDIVSITITPANPVLLLLYLAGMYAVFEQADRAGWKALIPVYNMYIMLKIGDNSWVWLAGLLIPGANFYAWYKINAGVARAFDAHGIFRYGLPILGWLFYPLLALLNKTQSESDSESTIPTPSRRETPQEPFKPRN